MNHLSGVKHTFVVGLILSAAAGSPAGAQQQLINSGEVLQNSIKDYEQGDYKKTITALKQIQEGDTNYYAAQYELALTYLADSLYEKSIALNKQLLQRYPEEERQILINIGIGYSYLGKSEQAIAYFDTAHMRYPHDYRPLYEKGVVYAQNEEYDKAAEQLQTALLYNPVHAKSHSLLGTVYALQGRLTEAMILMQGTLSATSEIELVRTPISTMSAIAMMKDEVAQYYQDKKPAYRHELFDEIDELIASKLALDKNFKISGKIDDGIIRQLQVIFEKLQYDETDNNFVMQYYVPLLLDIREKGLFDEYMLYLFSGYGIESVEKHVDGKKGKQKIMAISEIIDPYRKMILGTRTLPYKKRTLDRVRYLVLDGMFMEAQPADQTLTKLKAGPVKVYDNYVLRAAGHINTAEKREGIWKYYYPSGVLRLEESNDNGDAAHDRTTRYYPNGNIDYEVTYDQNNSFKSRTDYLYNGQKTATQIVDKDGNFKVTYLYPNGKEHYTMTFDKQHKDQAIDGAYKTYHPNGKLQKTYAIKNDQLDGLYQEYYDNGVLMIEAQYLEGKLDGTYKKFYKSGRPDMVYQYKDGARNGLCEDYYDDKESYFTQEYQDNQPHGRLERYNKNKVQYATVVYNKGVPVSAEYKDLDGKVVYSAEDPNGLSILESYNEYGTKIRVNRLNAKGQHHGLTQTYYESGVLKSEIPYTDDAADGLCKYYHANGTLAYQKTSVKGVDEGEFRSFSDAATLAADGIFHQDELQQVRYSYYTNGKVAKSNFYNIGERCGPEINYLINGNIDYINHYDKEVLVGVSQYDTANQLVSRLDFPKGKGTYTLRFPSGHTRVTVPLVYGAFNGTYLKYADDQTVIERCQFENGHREGLSELFHPNGKLWVSCHYHNGDRSGAYKQYNTAGELTQETVYENGEENGISKTYCGGQLRYQFTMKGDEKHGESVIYGDQGKIAGFFYHDNGLLIGYSYLDHQNHKVPMIPIQHGTASVKTFYPGGAKAMEFNYVNNLYEGSQKLYYSNGTLAENRNFSKGMYEGAYTRWNEDGSVLEASTYKHDQLQGIRKEYDQKGELISQTPYLDDERHGTMQLKDHNGKMKTVHYYYGIPM